MSAPSPMFDYTLPIFINSLKALSKILTLAEEHAKKEGMPVEELLTARLAPDMKPLPFQIQTSCDTAKGVLQRVAEQPAVPMADTEQTKAELHERLAKTLKLLESAQREHFVGKEELEVELMGRKMPALAFVRNLAIPNFFFHVTTAYDILRHKGVPLTKGQYLGMA